MPDAQVKGNVLIVGGGPTGLITALTLAKRGWRRIVVLERGDEGMGDTDKTFTYAIRGSALNFTDWLGVTSELEAQGLVMRSRLQMNRIEHGSDKRKAVAMRPTSRAPQMAAARPPVFLMRPAMMSVLRDFIRKTYPNEIEILHEMEVVSIDRVQKPTRTPAAGAAANSICVKARKLTDPNGALKEFYPSLLVGADGLKSAVREALKRWHADDHGPKAQNPFEMRKFPSASSGLRYKAVLLPAPFPLDHEGAEVSKNGEPYVLVGANKGFRKHFGLWCFPVSDKGVELAGGRRTAGFAGVDDHELFKCKTGEEVLTYLESNMPHLPVRRLLTKDQAARFAASNGIRFPAPQCTDRLCWLLPSEASQEGQQQQQQQQGQQQQQSAAAVLLGDALHCFPPDLGLGVNSAIEDVKVLRDALDAAGDRLDKALPAFEAERIPESYGIVRCVQNGYAHQYEQSHLRKRVWMVGFLARTLLHKGLPFLFSEPILTASFAPEPKFKAIWDREVRTKRLLRAMVGAAAIAAAFVVFRRVL